MTAAVRSTGTLVTWNDPRGFGFIAPTGGGPHIFVHISGFPPAAQRPAEGQELSFVVATNPDGRTKAVEVRPVGRFTIGRPGGVRSPLRLGTLSYVAIAVFIPLYIVAAVAWQLPWWVDAIYIATSAGAFAAYALDKSAALHGGWRIAERSMLLLGLIGGWPGAIVAQQLFRHKTRKRSFILQFWASVALNVILFLVLASPLTRDAVRTVFGA